MKTELKSLSRWISDRQPEWVHYAFGCIDAEMCPICGSIIFISEKNIDINDLGFIFIECPRCDWYNYV